MSTTTSLWTIAVIITVIDPHYHSQSLLNCSYARDSQYSFADYFYLPHSIFIKKSERKTEQPLLQKKWIMSPKKLCFGDKAMNHSKNHMYSDAQHAFLSNIKHSKRLTCIVSCFFPLCLLIIVWSFHQECTNFILIQTNHTDTTWCLDI